MESDYPAQHRYQTRSKSNKSKRKIYQHESSDDDNDSIYEIITSFTSLEFN